MRHFNRRSVLVTVLAFLVLFAPLFPLIRAQEILPTISVDPPIVLESDLPPGMKEFSINIYIREAVDVYAWEVYLDFAPIPYPPKPVLAIVDIIEGDFLTQYGAPTSFSKVWDNVKCSAMFGAFILGEYSGVTGEGILATVTFRIVGGGETPLHLHDTSLQNSELNPIDHYVEDGYFTGKAPYAYFTCRPNPVIDGYYPAANQTVTFNATLSYDPDSVSETLPNGNITSYHWDFGDGTKKIYIIGVNLTAITEHKFTQRGTYLVNLTVSDNDDPPNSQWYTSSIDIVIRDIAVANVEAIPTEIVRPAHLVKINVTVTNNGTTTETFNVTVYRDNTFLDTQTVTELKLDAPDFGQRTISFDWDTIGLKTDTYTIKAVAEANPGDKNVTNNELTTAFTISRPPGIPEIYVYPSEITSETPKYIGDTFTIYVNISDAIDLYAWEFSLGWNASMLNFVTVEEGDFLKDSWTTLFLNQTHEDETDSDHIIVNCTINGIYQGVYGDGTLAAITFEVQNNGSTILDLFGTKLWDQAMDPVTHTSANGFFTNLEYEHEIKVSLMVPASPIVGESYLLNATVTNNGLNNETAVELRIIINGTIVRFEVNIELKVGESYKLDYLWTPIVEGTYNITAYAPPLPDEAIITNNKLTRLVTVPKIRSREFSITHYGAAFKVFIRTDESTTIIRNFTFNYTARQISFEVEGSKGKTSFCNVTIPVNLMNVTDVKRNGTSVTDYKLTKNATHHFVYFKYTFSSVYIFKIGGTWVNAPPQVYFTASTTTAALNDPVTLDASTSSDPDPNGRIARYFFDFGDGANATGTPNYDPDTGDLINYSWIFKEGETTTEFNTTQPIIERSYEDEGTYTVSLSLTDKDGLKNQTSDSLSVFSKYDIAIVDVAVSPTTANIGESVFINVTITSKTLPIAGVTLVLTIYGNGSALLISPWPVIPGALPKLFVETTAPPVGGSKTVKVMWQTTEETLGTYSMSARITVTRIGTTPASQYPFAEIDLSDNQADLGDILVKKWDSLVNLVVSPKSFTVGNFTKITGTLYARGRAQVDADVFIESRVGDGDWTSIADVTTGVGGIYSHTWTPTSAGAYQVRARWLGDAMTSANTSAVVLVDVKRMVSAISIDVSPPSLVLGSSVIIEGEITPERSGVLVTITIRREGEVVDVFSSFTDSLGGYSYEWTPTEPGVYEIRTSWAGDVDTLGSESVVKTVTVQSVGFRDLYLYAAIGAVILVGVVVTVYVLRRRKTKP